MKTRDKLLACTVVVVIASVIWGTMAAIGLFLLTRDLHTP